jgi:hypothetical protein
MVIRWLGESNGCYGVGVNLYLIPPPATDRDTVT